MQDHNVRLRDFLPIVSNNPFVPQGREPMYAEGLYAGMEGDFMKAAHFLIPQFENSIRHILSQHDVVTSGIDSQGIQDERSLDTTLKMPELEEILGIDTVFDLRGILVERTGPNLRNLMAHGLMNYDSFFGEEVPYFWWHVLRLCCIPLISQQEDADN